MLIQTPDGNAEFPDNMPQDQVEAALRSHYGWKAEQSPAPQPAAASDWRRLPVIAGNALISGLAQGADLAMGPIYRAAADMPSPPTGSPRVVQPLGPNLSSIAAAHNPLPQIPPESPVERYGSAAITGAASALPMTLLGQPLATLAAGGAGGAASEAANELVPGSKAAELGAGLVAGLGTAGLASLARGGLYSLAKGLGKSETQQQAGEILQAQARDWLDNDYDRLHNLAAQPLDNAMHTSQYPNGPPTPVGNLINELQSITSKGGAYSGAASTIQPTIAQRLLDELVTPTRSPIGTWDDARDLRTLIGKGLVGDPYLRPLGQENLARMYKGITADLQNTAGVNGASDLFNNFNAESTRLHELAEQRIEPIVTAADPEKAFDIAMRGSSKGGSNLAALRATLPGNAVDEMAAAHLLQTPKKWTTLSDEAKAALVPDLATRSRIDDAVAAQGAKSPSSMKMLYDELVSGSAGEMLGALGHGLMPGNPSEIMGGAAGGLAGLAAPYVARGVASIVRNPARVQVPLAGVAGANSLSPGPTP